MTRQIPLVLQVALGATLVVGVASVQAGPPFMTDDPEPIGYRQSEAYLFSTMDKGPGGRTAMAPAFEFNYGPAPDWHLHAMVPFVQARPATGPNAYGLGDIELGAKYRFVHESASVPQVGVIPMLELPTGDADRGLGNGRAWGSLPLWIQKSWGPWTSYGGGGVTINSAPGMRNSSFAGWLVQRELGPRLVLGGELFYQGAVDATSQAYTLLNIGGYTRQITICGGCSLLFRLGASVAGEVHHGAYLGLYWTWGGESVHG